GHGLVGTALSGLQNTTTTEGTVTESGHGALGSIAQVGANGLGVGTGADPGTTEPGSTGLAAGGLGTGATDSGATGSAGAGNPLGHTLDATTHATGDLTSGLTGGLESGLGGGLTGADPGTDSTTPHPDAGHGIGGHEGLLGG
ncbi:MAG: hypothetical protein INR66_25350, partial [Gordonia polyisoprenivorans]|nr:hypothetical protein [Gordonia polyisoprenivorans]